MVLDPDGVHGVSVSCVMRDRWDVAFAPVADDPLGQCVYGSRLLGAEPTLVLHGGGNTSVKVRAGHLGERGVDLLYVKGSGWDLATIEPAGFTALRMSRLRQLLRLTRLSDAQMMNELRCARIDATAPDPSVESLLHALLPYPAVQHSHADALIALTNQSEPATLVERVFGAAVLIVPYVMPGFDLARYCATTVAPRLAGQGKGEVIGLVLLNHGLFTFGATTEEAYRRHIELIDKAERFLAAAPTAPPPPAARLQRPTFDPLRQARLRHDISAVAGAPMLVSRHDTEQIRSFVTRTDLATLASQGPLTPDHVIRTKRIPLIGLDVAEYTRDYAAYFEAHRDRRAESLIMVDPAPRVLLDPTFGMLTAGRRASDTDIAADIYRHTIDVILAAERVGRYQALPAADIFDVEYWELEQAKLRRASRAAAFTGEVALVTGAASGIGRACAQALYSRGAAVVGLDINPDVQTSSDWLGVCVDMTDAAGVDRAIAATVERFGGVDIVVAAAGIFPPTRNLSGFDPRDWQATMAINVDAVAHLFFRAHPLLALAPNGGRVVVIASKNVPAPGPGAAAYSASKAALTQLARVAALEWASDGIRVNVVHPDAVFDTGLWTEQILRERAQRYGLSVEEYKKRNLLGTEITSNQVADVVATLCSDTFAATTGAQIPIDGGSERVI